MQQKLPTEESGYARRPRGRRIFRLVLIVLAACPILGFITCSQVMRYRYGKVVMFVGEFVGSVRTGSDRYRESVARGDEAELEAARAWMTPEVEVVCGLIPPFSMTSYECWVKFSNGGRMYMDVYPGEKPGEKRVYVNALTPPWKRCAECHPNK